ncbi:lysophospholipid acyltransferase family protein [Xanthomonas fragariae]|uniref:1-acyl-sn-glycerol-3-phosphate acyltransferase n=1 Tax=Xanthomonas fragariae TaxID=48664 RepID=A0A1Y6HGC0_9XANT|nr:lysophospholipid acyltransferase family protein [Xanthomonas fragariae]AOD13676.1 acyltransferase [Xanthomonas fragariae]AOD19886.1 acyltransferase [Xanthomonas fragariae]ENZ95121.1 acyltransferase [Xanthomonas fragariae LMG 25863]MBL9197991.1 1-acyl-sn-glycerol-3-phosphate acyltransferase [Xanthomonas fragariae]MBL9222534.1 1-acyl-sn-glycerol-3-phosphate acyltransferase [Xanthomonas fragariae]
MPLPRMPLRLAWAVFNLLQLAFTLTFTAGGIVYALAVLAITRDADRLLRMGGWMWSPVLLRGAGAKLIVEGRERVDWSRNYLFVSNHQSVIDICVLFMALPVPLRFLLKDEMLKVPFVNWYARATGMLFLDRDSRRAGAMVRRQAAALLREGKQLCLFPEGTRSRTGALLPFKAGLLQAAIDAGVQVVPVAVDGCGKVLPVDGLFRVRPGIIRVRIGDPIAVTVPDAPDRQQLTEQAHKAVAAMLQPRI